MRRALLVALSTLALAACDATEEPPADAPGVQLAAPLPDLAFEFYDGVDAAAAKDVLLSDHFQAVGAGGALTYEATAEGAAAVALDGARLRVSPVSVGRGTVVVRAQAGDGAVVSDTFAVEVRTECPPGPGPGQADFLPLVVGETWRFRFSNRGRSGGTFYEERSTLTLSLVSATCADGTTRTVQAEERREGRLVRYGSTWADTTAVARERTVQVVETAEGVRLPWAAVLVGRYHPAGADTVRVEGHDGRTEVALVPGGLASLSHSGIPHVSSHDSYSLHRIDP